MGRGLGQQPISFLCVSVPASVCPSPSKSPESPVTTSLPQVLSPPFLPVSASPAQCSAQLTWSLSSSSWGLSVSIPWGEETDGGGVAGIWEEEGWNPRFLRGVGAGRGGGEPGAGCLGTEQEAGFLVSPPTGPAHPCQLPPVLFSHPNCLLDLSCPRGAQRLGKAPPAAVVEGVHDGEGLLDFSSYVSVDPQPPALFSPLPSSPSALFVNTGTSYTGSGFTPQNPPPAPRSLS